MSDTSAAKPEEQQQQTDQQQQQQATPLTGNEAGTDVAKPALPNMEGTETEKEKPKVEATGELDGAGAQWSRTSAPVDPFSASEEPYVTVVLTAWWGTNVVKVAALFRGEDATVRVSAAYSYRLTIAGDVRSANYDELTRLPDAVVAAGGWSGALETGPQTLLKDCLADKDPQIQATARLAQRWGKATE